MSTPTLASAPTLRLTAVTVRYTRGGVAAVNELDLSVDPGERVAFVGPSGAGKSTLINILAGLVVKTAGQAAIWGYDIDDNPRAARSAIGVVPQEINIDPFFTPRELLELQAGLYGLRPRQRRTDEIPAAVGLTTKADSYARALSGGMRRRLLVAKAMVHAPPVLVLDEPTAGVDIELREQFWREVKITGRGEDLNQTLERAGRVADFFELGELMCIDALDRNESCGGHFREEYQENGEALRDDANFSYVAAWEWTGDPAKPRLQKEPLTFEYVKPTKRSYK